DERKRTVLELSRRVGLGVDVRDFLQLERAFERDGVVQPAPEEQSVLLLGEALGPGDDLRLEREHRAERRRQVPQGLHVLFLFPGSETRTYLGQREREQEKPRELR